MKILYFGDCTAGAMGNINRDIKKILDRTHPEIQFDMISWGTPETDQLFWTERHWKNYDLIIVDPQIAMLAHSGWRFDEADHELFKSKLIPIYANEIDIPAGHFQHGWRPEFYTTPLCGINTYIVNQIRDKGVESQILPTGVNVEKFKPFKEVKKIKKIGWIGNGFQEGVESWKSIKRPDIFKEICEKANIEYITIHDRPHGWKMYEDVDAIICTSSVEGNPMGLLEVSACKIPFISTNVGIVREYSKVKTFETIDDAIAIIDYLNESEDNIKDYVNKLYGELLPDRDWENILDKYWIPYFNKLVNKNKQ